MHVTTFVKIVWFIWEILVRTSLKTVSICSIHIFNMLQLCTIMYMQFSYWSFSDLFLQLGIGMKLLKQNFTINKLCNLFQPMVCKIQYLQISYELLVLLMPQLKLWHKYVFLIFIIGQPYNQLAILASSKGDTLGTVYFYCRRYVHLFCGPAFLIQYFEVFILWLNYCLHHYNRLKVIFNS